jgi:hypothetical protein
MFYVIPAIYLALTLILGVFCVFATVLVVRTHFREENIAIPICVLVLLYGLILQHLSSDCSN